ncbi:SDR family oxidoreductase [Virgibacillus sp. MSP4-1]|uniref:SDR family NAD(P)-dependent oxidoreductase n=1 Tax=Virgibacillus sp. MSP4-1 TaxID=2700081 RepID=UPI0003A2B6FB|nr:SDR family oxidoreductase [Virgibacillus sp. MSP4-1]QHS22656.1 SDR family oxidoreductase [Virgibacillus sp. MSP4-1]
MINGKRIVITGASSGIGSRIAWHVAENGGFPILIARSRDKLEKITEGIRQNHSLNADYYVCDVGNEKEWQGTMNQIVEDFGQIHVLINNAGFGLFQPVSDMKLTEFEDMYRVNVYALIQASQIFASHMAEFGEGHIMNIASQAGKMATPKAAGYAATKHAVVGFTHGLRMEVEQQGVFVTAVNLGPVKTNFFETADPSGGYAKSVDRYMLDADKVAQKIVQKIYRPVREINLPLWMELGSRIHKLFPHLVEKVLKGQFRKK